MDDRDILKAIGVEMEVANSTGFVNPKQLGMISFSQSQLKEISKLLSQRARMMNPDEVAREVSQNKGQQLDD